MKKVVFALLMGFITICVTNCNEPDRPPCDEVVQPPIRELSKWQKQRFPYENFKSLTFIVEEPGRKDTVTLKRIKYDTVSTHNFGSNNKDETGCVSAYHARHERHLAIYGEDYKDRLTFENCQVGSEILAKWLEDSTRITHHGFNEYYGYHNTKLPDDTVTKTRHVYENVISGEHGTFSLGK